MKVSPEALESEAERQGLSSRSREAYARTWRELWAFCASRQVDVLSLGEDRAREFFARAADGKAAATQIQLLAALRRVYAYTRTPNPFDRVQRPRASALNVETRFLTAADLGTLFHHLSQASDYYGQMSYVLTVALFDLARRYFELSEATRAQLVQERGRWVAIRILGKGNKHSVKPLTTRLGELLGKWMTFVELSKGARLRTAAGADFARSDLIFPTLEGKVYSNQSYNRRLAAACRQAGLPIISAHVLRHSAATHLMNHAGVTLPELKEILDHTDVRTTVRYTHTSPARIAAAMENLGHVSEAK